MINGRGFIKIKKIKIRAIVLKELVINTKAKFFMNHYRVAHIIRLIL